MNNSLLVQISIIILLGCTSSKAQSLHELTTYSKVEGVQRIKSWTYNNIELDKKDQPILIRNAHRYSETEFENGYQSNFMTYDYKGEKEMQFVFSYDKGNMSKAEIFSYYKDKAELFKWYQIFYKKGEISHENIFYNQDDLKGTINYETSIDKNGNKVIESTLYKPKETGSQGGFNYVYNKEDLLIQKVVYVGQDTGLTYNVIETVGDSIVVANTLSKQRDRANNGEWVDLVTTMITKTRKDVNGTPTYIEMSIEGYDVNEGKDIKKLSVTILENYYEDGTVTGGVASNNLKNVSGSYYDENADIVLTLSEDGGCAISTYNDPEDPSVVQEEKLVSTSDWSYTIIDQNSCNYDPVKATITFDGSIKEVISLNMRFDKLELIRPSDREYMEWDQVYLTKK